MKEKQLKDLLDSLNQLTAELGESDNITVTVKEVNKGQFSVLTLDKNTVFTKIELTQRSKITVENPL